MAAATRLRILVIGELNVDIVATGLRSVPRYGTEILANGFEVTLGSASAIFAMAMARLGHEVTFISEVGDDEFVHFCLSALSERGIATDRVSRKKNVKTGVTISLSSKRDRALVTYPGAIASFDARQLKLSALEFHNHLHMTSYFLQDGLRPSFQKIFAKARKLGMTTSFDPNSDPTGRWKKSIYKVLNYSDVLFVNQREALQLTRTVTVSTALESLAELSPCAVVKLGARGSAAIRDHKVYREAGFKVSSLDTTGAGDSFDAGFISAYLQGRSLSDCLRTGNACGALSSLKGGGTAGQPSERQLKKFLRAH